MGILFPLECWPKKLRSIGFARVLQIMEVQCEDEGRFFGEYDFNRIKQGVRVCLT